MSEVFQTIPGYAPYEVSNLGRLRRNGIVLSTPIAKNVGYKRKYLKDLKKNLLMHRAIAICFIPNPLNLPCVNHIDRDKSNNSIPNLEWATHKRNIQHAVADARANGGTWVLKCDKSPRSKLKNEHIPLIKDAIKAGFSQRKIASYFKVTQTAISYINRGINWASL